MELVKQAKFKVGDYITAPNRVYLKIVAIVDSGLGPMYGVVSPRGGDVGWMSQYQLDEDEMIKTEPNFERFLTIKAGDILKVGHEEKDPYVTVLARVDNAVLLSAVPKKGLAEQMLRLDQYMKRMAAEIGESFEDIMSEDDKRFFKRMGSQLHTSKIADMWMDITTLTLMHWDLVEE